MEKQKKMTKAQMYAKILAHTTDADEKAFLEHEMELLAKKNAGNGTKSLTPTQKENEGIKTAIVEYLTETEGKMTITDMIKSIPECGGLTNQRVSALVRQLVNALVLVRTEEKGKAYFAIA